MVSLITICRGRLAHLRATLPRMLSQQGLEYELVVVSYGDAELSAWLPEHVSPPQSSCRRLVLIDVRDSPYEFNRSHARNIGGVMAAGDPLVFLDADIGPSPGWLAQMANPIVTGQTQFTGVAWRTNPLLANFHGHGVMGITAELFRRTRGFDEGMRHWGYEDTDFWQRVCGAARLDPHYVDARGLDVIQHQDDLRAEHQPMSLNESRALNVRHAQVRGPVVNPHGFGVSTSRVWTIDWSL